MKLKRFQMQLMMSLLISSLVLVSCSPKIQVGPTTMVETPTQTVAAGTPHLPKPNNSLTKAQWDSLSRDIKEVLTKRELQWTAVYKDYLLRK